jgi:hypothetical protein
MGMKRECGDGKPEAAAAPATVSGERKARCHWERPGKAALMLRPASQETCLRAKKSARCRRGSKEVAMTVHGL